jgi:SecD/SecF fusion protein
VTVDTVAALLTILGYSMYDTIIVFDRVRENIPRMPRAAFSQIVNRSMSEVLTRSIATTSCTLIPIICLLLFGGSTLKDFAFALMIGVASGAYSSIFIASPVLTHWKEREPAYRARRHRIEDELGMVPAYATVGSDVEPVRQRGRRTGRLTQPEPDVVSSAEFEQMKREIAEEQAEPSRHTSTLTKRLSHTDDTASARSRADAEAALGRPGGRAQKNKPQPAKPAPAPADRPKTDGDGGQPAPDLADNGGVAPAPDVGENGGVIPAPDVAENDGVAPVPKSNRPAKSRSRNRRHGRRR